MEEGYSWGARKEVGNRGECTGLSVCVWGASVSPRVISHLVLDLWFALSC